MLKKTITFSDLDGNAVTSDFYFNLSKAELTEMELSTKGGMQAYLQSIIASEDGGAIIQAYKDILRRSYGRRSADNQSFVKSEAAWDHFVGTEAYSILFMELCTDAEKSAEFINGVMPADLIAAAKKEAANVQVELPQPKQAVPQFVYGEDTRQPTQAQLLSMSPEEFLALKQHRMERPS